MKPFVSCCFHRFLRVQILFYDNVSVYEKLAYVMGFPPLNSKGHCSAPLPLLVHLQVGIFQNDVSGGDGLFQSVSSSDGERQTSVWAGATMLSWMSVVSQIRL